MVTRPHHLPPLDDRGDLGVVLQAAQNAIAQEFAISERLEAKATSQIASAGTWFAIVGGISAAILTRAKPPGSTSVDVVVALGFLAVLLLVITLIRVRRVWALQDEVEIAPAALSEMAAVARDPDDELADKLVHHYAAILASRRKNNKTRANAFREATPWWLASLLVTLAQLVAVLVAAAFG